MLNRLATLRTSLFALPFTSNFSNMARKQKSIPDPTVPTAIAAREGVASQSGGASLSFHSYSQ